MNQDSPSLLAGERDQVVSEPVEYTPHEKPRRAEEAVEWAEEEGPQGPIE